MRESNIQSLLLSVLTGVIAYALIGYFRNFSWNKHLDQTILCQSNLAPDVSNRVRIYAIIATTQATKYTKAVHVKATWAKRFDAFMFLTSEQDNVLPSIRVVDEERRRLLWQKTRNGFMYIYRHHLNDYHFFMKTDDDTYVVVENLRFLLSSQNHSTPIILGRQFKWSGERRFPSGGAGYVISRAGVKLIAEGMIKGVASCAFSLEPEDVSIGLCAADVGVKWVESVDENGLETFHPVEPSRLLVKSPKKPTEWIHRRNYFPLQTGLSCCSDHSVSFHYMSPQNMYLMEFLIYRLQRNEPRREMCHLVKLVT